jgi:hypothetical protein
MSTDEVSAVEGHGFSRAESLTRPALAAVAPHQPRIQHAPTNTDNPWELQPFRREPDSDEYSACVSRNLPNPEFDDS